MSVLREGQRVRVKSIDSKGRIFYINQADYYEDHFLPIQIELDTPYSEHGQTMYRTDIKDIVRLKPKKKPKKVVDDDEFDFTDL